MTTCMNWIMAYKPTYLKIWKEAARAERPSFKSRGMQVMSWMRLVKGAATEDSVVERDTPRSADLRPMQSFEPSPHMPISSFKNF